MSEKSVKQLLFKNSEYWGFGVLGTKVKPWKIWRKFVQALWMDLETPKIQRVLELKDRHSGEENS